MQKRWKAEKSLKKRQMSEHVITILIICECILHRLNLHVVLFFPSLGRNDTANTLVAGLPEWQMVLFYFLVKTLTVGSV